MKFNDLSSGDKARINAVAVFAALSFFSLLLAVGGVMAQRQQADLLSRFATESATTSGVVTKHATEEMNGNTEFWDIDASFTAADGSSHALEFRVPQEIFNQYTDGDPIPVTYLKDDPAQFYIPGAEPKPSDGPLLGLMGKVAATAAVLLALGLAVSIYMARNVGKSDGRRAPTAPGPSATRVQAAERSGFGSRNLIR